MIKYISILIGLFFCTNAHADPTISNVSGVFKNLSTVTISGTAFGTKSTASPAYWNTFDLESGERATGLSGTTRGVISTTQKRGTKSLLYSFDCDASSSCSEQFIRDVYGFGNDGADTIFISQWVYLDTTGSTTGNAPDGDQWQWKSIVVGTEPSGYFSATANYTSAGFQNWYFLDGTPRWGNTNGAVYYNGLTSSGGWGLPSDAYLFGQWQRIDITLKRSSAAGASDGVIRLERLGRATRVVGESTTAVTHDADDLPWRNVGIGQAIASIYNNMHLVLKVFYDDLYIDNTLARIELCSESEWALRTHCEIQKPTDWSTSSTSIQFNSGSITGNAYLYVVDSSGSASNPIQITIGTSEAKTDFAAPVVTLSSNGANRQGNAATVTLTANETATIYYTTDGTTPTASSAEYSSPLTIKPGVTLKYFAKDESNNTSPIATNKLSWPCK